MANRERGEFTVRAGDQTLTLRVTTNAMAELEDFADGRTWDHILAGINRGSVKDLKLFLWAALRDKHPDIATLKPKALWEIGVLIDQMGGVDGLHAQIKAFVKLNADPEPATEKKGRPRKANGSTGADSTPTASPLA